MLDKTNFWLQIKYLWYIRTHTGRLGGLHVLFCFCLCRLKQQDTRQQYSYNEVLQYGCHYDMGGKKPEVYFFEKLVPVKFGDIVFCPVMK